MAITRSLYPPLCPDTIPAFIRTTSCKIYFSLSMYNSAADIKNVQISLVNQRTNASALKTSAYPSGIKIASLYYDPDVRGDYNYYVQINPSDLAEGSFGLNQFYKVQLRFTSKSASNPPSSGAALAKWLYDNMQYFSEWSKVCLIKGIEQPYISIRGFNDIENSQETVLTNPMLEVIGELTYAKNSTQEKEYLKSYNIKLYQANNMDNVLMQSEEVYTNPHNPNEFNYELSYDLLDGVNYVMALTYTTNNLYTETINYKFTVIQHGVVDKLNADITATVDEENGRIKIDIISKDTEKFIGNLTIRRTSSESNFHKWEDIKTVTYITGTELNYSWYDTTIQSGVWYRYCAQKRNAHGDRGAIIQINNPVMCLFDDIFLTRDDCQLKIKFNPTLSEFKYNVTESQQVTIGAKYPYIKRNGNNYFRTFTIGGLISSFIDTTDWYDPHFYNGEFHYDENEIKAFTSKADIYGESQKLYDDYNNKKGITEYNDYIYEREFRKKVYDFLYKHNVKLFRSTTEGNILIKLMNIDFQPVETLGRRLYSFTATAVEVDDATIANYNKYGIQITGNYEKYINYRHEVLGQISGTYQASDGNILSNKISPKYRKSSNKGFINQVGSLRWLKLEIESDPYVIIESGGQLVKATSSSDIEAPDATVGHIVVINGAEMIVYPHMERRPTGQPGNGSTAEIVHLGIFELKEDNTLVTDLRFKYPTTVTIGYIANLEEVEDTSGLANRIYYYHKPGQLYGSFEPKDSLMRKIYNKYLLNYKKYYQRLLDVTDIRVEGQPGTVVYVKDSKDTGMNRHILENGYLQLRDSEATIEGLYFCGVHLTECIDPLETEIVNGLTGNDFKLQDGIYDSIDEIKNPVNAGIYQIRAYGLKSGAFLQNNRVIVVNKDNTEHTEVTPDNYYTLILEPIEDDKKLQFVYYYGCWYTLAKGYEKTKLLGGDIRQVRDNEYILVNEYYDSFAEIENPIPNGVYWISPYAVDDEDLDFDRISGLLTISEDSVYANADRNYALIIEHLYEESKNRYIYYHGDWRLFTPEHDVLCPVDGLVDYYCEVMKGVY